MKKQIIKYLPILLVLAATLAHSPAFSQGTEKKNLKTEIRYVVADNKVPYLVVSTKTKVEKKFVPVKDISVTLYMDKDSSGKPANALGTFKTNAKGKALATLPPGCKDKWTAATSHSFFASTAETKEYNASDADVTVGRARITIDTADDQNVKVVVTAFVNNQWVPQKGVEVKIGVKRLSSYLPIGDDASYTTDSLGVATGQFKKAKIPGDMNNEIIIGARVEDNDQFGNLVVEKKIPWGKYYTHVSTFNDRTLWSTRLKTPVWLLLLAYTIAFSVWGTVIYLIVIIFKIRKLGKQEPGPGHH